MTLDDLASDATIELLRTSRCEGVRNLPALIAIIARNVAAGEIRRRGLWRRRFADWEQNSERIFELPSKEWDDSLQLLWFMLVEHLRATDAPCHGLAIRYAELESWKAVAAELGVTHETVRQRWVRCTARFLDALRKDPGPFEDWLGDG